MNNVQQQRKTTLPTSKSGAHSKQNEMFTLITGSNLCYYRSCFFCVCYITSYGNFDLHLQSLAHIVPWMFALYQTRYSRWLSVRIRDMKSLLVNHPNIRAELRAGKIVVHKTSSMFSAMTIDQCHEQDNGAVSVSDAQEPWQSLKWQHRLQHLKRIKWQDDQEPNRTTRIFTMKATWVCNLPFSKTSNL